METSKEIFERLLKQIDNEKKENAQTEKKPCDPTKTVEKWSDMSIHQERKTNCTRMKQIVSVYSNVYETYKNYVLENPQLRFYITCKNDNIYYMFIVYKKSVEMKFFGGVIYWTVYSSYLENIMWIWKHGMLVETYNYSGDLRQLDRNQPKAAEVLQMSDEEAQKTLTLREYAIYKKLKEKFK